MSKIKRRRLLADLNVQGALAVRLVLYWVTTWSVVLGIAAIVAVFFGVVIDQVSVWPLLSEMLGYLWIPLLLSLAVLPILVRDCLRVSNRFAGPALRFRREMKQLASGEPAKPINLRSGDFWQDIADDFNRVLVRYQASEQASASENVSA